MSISLLAREGTGFAEELKSSWLDYHQFWLPEDIFLIRELAEVPEKHSSLKYEKQVVEMFRIVVPRLNKRRTRSQEPSVLH
jgi:hypothetical protein